MLQVAIRRGLGASGKPPVRPQAQTPAPVGPDAPTPARIGICRPKGRSHFSFGGERKVCKRKPAARRLREKALDCPFLKEGVRNVARSTLGLPTWTFVRARAHSNPLSKRARLFPSAAYRRSAPRAVGGGQAYPLRVGMVSCWLADFGRSSASGFGGREPQGLSPNGGLHSPSGREPHQTGEPRGLSPSGGSFTAKPHVPRAPCAPTARSPG